MRWIDLSIPDLLVDLENEGLEFDIVGSLTPNLTAIASYTDMKLRDYLGRRRPGVADEMYNALVEYSFLNGPAKGLSLFASVNHKGSVAGEEPPDRTKLGDDSCQLLHP